MQEISDAEVSQMNANDDRGKIRDLEIKVGLLTDEVRQLKREMVAAKAVLRSVTQLLVLD